MTELDKDQHKIIKNFLAASIAFLIFIIIIFLAQSHKRLSIEEALKSIPDKELNKCIREHSEASAAEFCFEIKQLSCNLQTNKVGNPIYIKDLSGLEQLKYLESLDLSYSQIKSLLPIKNILSLKTLKLSNSNIYNIDDLKYLSSLKDLDLSGNSIDNIKPLRRLAKLNMLNLGVNNISDIRVLASHKELSKLDISSNLISDISPVSKLDKLEYLDISDNSISKISAISSLKKLKKFKAANNSIVSISGLTQLTKLRHLDLANNQICSLESFSKANLPDLNANLRFNDNIPCTEIKILKAKLSKYPNASIKEPKSCSSRAQKTKNCKTKKKFFGFL